MAATISNVRTCKKGHRYSKSSDCPTCPVCEKERKPKAGFLSLLAAPARRALESKGITTVRQLSKYSEQDLLHLHGIGKTSLPILKKVLKTHNLNFKAMKKDAPLEKSDHEGVSQHIQKLDPAFGKIIETLRQIILKSDKNIGERIKWNNPSFFYTGKMNDFDPKEFKRELIVFNLFKNRILLVFPSGARVNDTSGLLEGDYKDGRRIILFKDLADVKSKEKQLQTVVKQWVKTIDK